mgnify:FL=1
MEFLFLVGLCLFVYLVYNWRDAAPGKLTGAVAIGSLLAILSLFLYIGYRAGRPPLEELTSEPEEPHKKKGKKGKK